MKKLWNYIKFAALLIKDSVAEFFKARTLKLSAALAYYTVFSLPGLIIIIIWISDIFWGQDAVEGTVYGQISGLVGSDAALQIQQTIKSITLTGESYFATIIGLATLIIGATSVFGEIQDSINLIWKLKAKPSKGKGWLKFLINRLLSFSIIVTLGFLLLVSLVLNGIMDLLITRLTNQFPESQVILAYVTNLLLTFLITSFLFGLIFKILPDARIKWKHVRNGAFFTALLFMGGKSLISYYLGHSTMSSAYGAAGSVIVILTWVYYSAAILYMGAIFTRVYALHTGHRIYPNSYAVWVEEVEVADAATSLQAKEEQVVEVVTEGDKKAGTT